MGEAKRRRLAANRTVQYRDQETGETMTMRVAGDPLAWRDEQARKVERAIRGIPNAFDAAVPCNGCRECCWHAGVDVYPAQEAPENLPHLDMEQRPDGKWYLRKRPDGACIHLGPKGCTVYEHRPRACRSYDCRVFALVNVLDTFGGEHRQPPWVFEPRNLESRAFLAATLMLGLLKFHEREKSGENQSAKDIAMAVFTDQERLQQAVEAFKELLRLSPEQLAKTLGFDPRTLTPEQIREGLAVLVGGRSRLAMHAPDKPSTKP